MWLVFSDSTRRAAHAHIGQTSQRVADFLWYFEVGNCEQKWHFSSAVMSIFSPMVGDRATFTGLIYGE